MIDLVAPNTIIFSNANFDVPKDWKSCSNAKICTDSFASLGFPFAQTCLLDSEAPETLQPNDADSFTHFLFGGILGNSKVHIISSLTLAFS